jgi:PAS domain-containing protein
MLYNTHQLKLEIDRQPILADVLFGHIRQSVLVLSHEGVIKYHNQHFAEKCATPSQPLLGTLAKSTLKNACWVPLFQLLSEPQSAGLDSQCHIFDDNAGLEHHVRVVWTDTMVLVFMEHQSVAHGLADYAIGANNLEQLINAAAIPIWLLDASFKIIHCNSSFERWIAHFVGRKLSAGDNIIDSSLPMEYLAKFVTCYELALAGKTFATVEDMKVDGELRFTTVNFSPLVDRSATGNIIGITCSASDITAERKHLSKLEAQAQLLAEIAETQSHKVRGPVSTLLGLVEVFNFDNLNDPANVEVMNGVQETAHQLDIIIKGVVRSVNRWSNSVRK